MNRGLTMHERNCKSNPALIRPAPKEEKEQPKEPAQEQKPLIITNVQPALVDPVADDLPWFEDAHGNRKTEMYRFIGIHENIPCVLVMTVYGRLVPPYLVPGFIGMFPKYYVFPEAEPEPQPEDKPPVIASDKPIISPLEEEKFAQVIPQEPIHAQTEKKQSLLDRIRGKKEKATTETTTSSADLAKRIIDAQGS